MLKVLVKSVKTVIEVPKNLKSDIIWYTTMTKVAYSIVKESQDLKCHSIKCKSVNKLRHIVKLVKKTSHF